MSDVVLSVAGDRASIEANVDPSVPLGWMLDEWAAACSSHTVQELVMVSDDGRRLFDPNATPGSLGLADRAVVRLMTAREAKELSDGNAADAPASGWYPPAGRAWSPDGHPPTQGAWPPGGAAREQRSGQLSAQPSGQDRLAPPGFEPAPPAGFRETDEELPGRVPSLRRFSRAVKAVLSRRARPAPQAGRFAKPAVPTAGKRYREAIQANDRTYNLDRIIREAPLGRCVVIAVVSPKGGRARRPSAHCSGCSSPSCGATRCSRSMPTPTSGT